MKSRKKNMDSFKQNMGSVVAIIICIVITQAIAYGASKPMTYMGILNRLAYFTIGVQWLVFIHASGVFGNARTEKYYDLTGALTYLSTLALSIYYSREYIAGRKILSARQIILSTFVAIWCTRLGIFLFMRISNNSGVDSRFTELKTSILRFLVTWTLQGVWVFLTMLPVNILHQYGAGGHLNVYDYIGIPLWVIGFGIESIADWQKSQFRSDPTNKDKWISSGLWSISRHPNYFGEILLWTGISLSCFGDLDYKNWKSYFVFLSPIFVTLLLNYVSGVPMLERKSDRLYGTNEEYIKYKKETSVLVPFIGKKGDF